MRAAAGSTAELRRLAYIADTATASTPDTPRIRSADRYAAYGARNESVIPTSGSSIRRQTWISSQPTTSPITTPATRESANLAPASQIENVPTTTARTAYR